METVSVELALIDWVGVGALVLGYFYGLNKGLGPVFGMMLWLIAAMWIGRSLAPILLGWVADPQDAQNWHTQFMAYGGVTGMLLALPILGRIFGGRDGKKQAGGEEPHNKHFGSLVGVVCACLFFTLSCPYAHRFEFVAKSYDTAAAPAVAIRLAEHMAYLYPPAHLQALRHTLSPEQRGKVNNARAKAKAKRAKENAAPR